MRVLVACEFSGIVRTAFNRLGHDAWSVDLLPTEMPGDHFIDDALTIARMYQWDLMIAHPPCTYLTRAGLQWEKKYPERIEQRYRAYEFVMELYNCPIPRIAIENPVGRLSSMWRKPDQYIQPWMFGHGEVKKTGLWLKNLPLLQPTDIVDGREPKVHYASPGPDRWRVRSRTLPGIAQAFAEQWGS